MKPEKFEILKRNIKNIPACDLPISTLYYVSHEMSDEQRKEYAAVLKAKGVITFEYGHAFIKNNKEYMLF